MRKTFKIIIFTIFSFFTLAPIFAMSDINRKNNELEKVNVQKQTIETYDYDPNLPPDGIVDFPDEDFQTILNRTYFGQSDDHSITRLQMESLNEIYISGSIDGDIYWQPSDTGFIEDINGIQYAENITSFKLINQANNLDLTPLSNLTNITELDLTKCGVIDIKPLEKLVNLEKFTLEVATYSYNTKNVENLYILENFVNLKSLKITLSDSHLDQTSPANILEYTSDLKNLNSIELNNVFKVTSPAYELKYANNIEYFKIRYSLIEDISFIKEFTNLTYLQISNSNVTEIPDLSNLQYLKNINLSHNEIYDFSPLGDIEERIDNFTLNNQIVTYRPSDVDEQHSELPNFQIILINGDKLDVETNLTDIAPEYKKYSASFDADPSDKESISGYVGYWYYWDGTWVDINNPDINNPDVNNPTTKNINWLNIVLLFILITTIVSTFIAIAIYFR